MKKQFRSFEDSRDYVHSLKLKSQKEWNTYRKSTNRPKDIPVDPSKTYKNMGWVNWRDWLGYEDLYSFEKKYRSFDEARKFVHKLKLKNIYEWYDYCKSGKKPDDILSEPRRYPEYKGIGDWLGTGRIGSYKKQGLPWSEAKLLYQKIAKENNIKTQKQWYEFVKNHKLPKGLPPRPDEIYEEFVSNADCFGFDQRLNFDEARKLAHSLNLKSRSEWVQYLKSGKKPDNIPNSPAQVYKEWNGWADFLGTENLSAIQISEKQLPWSEAKLLYQKITKENNIQNESDWIKYIKTHDLPKGLPKYPRDVYTKSKILRRSINEKTI